MAIRLISSQGTWDLAPGEMILGRDRSCPLHLDDPRISRRHARLQLEGQELSIEDLGSINGILVNGDPVQKRCILKVGDELVIGPYLFKLTIDNDPQVPAAPTGTIHPVRREDDLLPDDDRMLRKTMGMDPADLRQKQNEPLTLLPGTAPQAGVGVAGRVNPARSAALTANLERPPMAPTPRPEPAKDLTDRLVPSQLSMKGTEALLPKGSLELVHHHLLKIRSRRLAAIAWDGLLVLIVAALPAGLVLSVGWATALRLAKAHLDGQGLPSLIGSGPPGSFWVFLRGTLDPQLWPRLGDLLSLLNQDHRQAFLTIFIAATLAMICVALAVILLLVAPTVQQGAPWGHRRLGLVIHRRPDNLPPGPVRSLVRWTLAILLAPLILPSLFTGHRGLHDQLTGCWVRAQQDQDLDK